MRSFNGVFRRSTRSTWSISVLLVVLFTVSACADDQETVILRVGEHPFRVELAVTDEERQRGLMFRRELEPDAGMLFVFEESALRTFWIKDTPLSLSIAYIDARGRILEIHDMEPHSLTPVRSRYPARYALEVNQGRFRELGIRPGDRIDLDALPRALRR